jgi:hypothetical protein
MGIEQIRMNQTKALPPVPQLNWSQMESSYTNGVDGGSTHRRFIDSSILLPNGSYLKLTVPPESVGRPTSESENLCRTAGWPINDDIIPIRAKTQFGQFRLVRPRNIWRGRYNFPRR